VDAVLTVADTVTTSCKMHPRCSTTKMPAQHAPCRIFTVRDIQLVLSWQCTQIYYSTTIRKTTFKMTRRGVQFSFSQTRITTYDDEIDRSLIWYKPEDLQQFKEDRITDAIKITNDEYSGNDEEICWWGLERLIVPSVRSKTKLAREQVKQVVLRKQDHACSDKKLMKASQWAATTAQKKATYYSLHQ